MEIIFNILGFLMWTMFIYWFAGSTWYNIGFKDGWNKRK